MELINSIENFNGESGPCAVQFIRVMKDWITQFEVAEPTKTLLLRAKCWGKAADFLNTDPAIVNENNFEVLCDALIAKFTNSESQQELHSKFSKVSQQPNQTVSELVVEIKMIVGKILVNPNINRD